MADTYSEKDLRKWFEEHAPTELIEGEDSFLLLMETMLSNIQSETNDALEAQTDAPANSEIGEDVQPQAQGITFILGGTAYYLGLGPEILDLIAIAFKNIVPLIPLIKTEGFAAFGPPATVIDILLQVIKSFKKHTIKLETKYAYELCKFFVSSKFTYIEQLKATFNIGEAADGFSLPEAINEFIIQRGDDDTDELRATINIAIDELKNKQILSLAHDDNYTINF